MADYTGYLLELLPTEFGETRDYTLELLEVTYGLANARVGVVNSTLGALTLASTGISPRGLIRGISTTLADYEAQPVRTSTWRSIANNWNHTADERSRTLVCWAAESTTTGGIGNSKGSSVWGRLVSFGPFPLLVGADGRPYTVRLAVGGRSTASAYLRIGVCIAGTANEQMGLTTAPANVLETAAFNNATNLWRIDGYVTLDAEFVNYAIVNGLSGTSPSSVAAVLVTVEVWAKAVSTLSVYATQAYAAEQVPL
jgi:hypothetical protein